MYHAFGLNIESEIELPELLYSDGTADITISLGKVPDFLENPIENTPWYEVGMGQFLLRVDGISKYYVTDGKYIIIEPHHGVDLDDIRVFLVNTVLAVLLLQRNCIVLHGHNLFVQKLN